MAVVRERALLSARGPCSRLIQETREFREWEQLGQLFKCH